ncbi:MAG: glycosyltransferase family 2 protein, partial [Acidobacteriota bacterium]
GAMMAVGGYLYLRGWPEDYDLWLRLIARGARFAKVPAVLHVWREHDDRLTRTDARYATRSFLACKAAHLADGPLADAEAVLVWGAGPTGRRLLADLQVRGVPIVACIDVAPRKIGGRLRGVPVVGPESLPPAPVAGERLRLITAVGARGARALLRRRLTAAGWVEGRDFWCAA